VSSDHDAFVRGIATILWGLAWADHADGHKCCNLSGCKIEDHMPEIPPIAWQWAERIAGRIEGEIGISLLALYAAALRAGSASDGDEQRFGECLAYAAMGHGVSWLDDHDDFEVLYIDPRMFSTLRFYGNTDEAQVTLADHAADTCTETGRGVRCF
jgi:hypothetical protein